MVREAFEVSQPNTIADTWPRLFTLRGQSGAIFALVFLPDDNWIVSGSLDGTIQYWDRSDGKLMATAVTGSAGRWLVLTEAGFYAGSEGSDEAIGVVRGNTALPRSACPRAFVPARPGRATPQGRSRPSLSGCRTEVGFAGCTEIGNALTLNAE